MNESQEHHLKRIKDAFDGWCDSKYRAGAFEHGGDLQELSPLELIDAAIDEAIDSFTYLFTIRHGPRSPMPQSILRES